MSVLVVGSLHLDVVLRARHLPQLDETVTGTGVDYVFGGKGGNQARAAARMGARVAFAGRAGSDQFGDMLRAGLAGIDTSQLQRDTGPSGMSAAIVNDAGDYGAVIVSAANLNIDTNAIDIPQSTKLVLLQNEIPETVNAAIAAKAQMAGAQVWLNAAPARPLSDALAASVDLLVVNRVEADFYAGDDRFGRVLTTLGANGVSYDGQRCPAPKVDVVSTHGAGDMFMGALAARCAAGHSVKDALPFAQAAAALLVAADGPARDTLDAARVAQFLATHPRL
ncbi:MAG: PfkB family carbohydrate kinase [Pseudomonadota bacterium]